MEEACQETQASIFIYIYIYIYIHTFFFIISIYIYFDTPFLLGGKKQVPNYKKPRPVYWTDLNADPPLLYKNDGEHTVSAKLEVGPDGFGLAKFDGDLEQCVSEVPNVILEAKALMVEGHMGKPQEERKQKKRRIMSKKPSCKGSLEEEEEKETTKETEQLKGVESNAEKGKKLWAVMYYKRSNSIGLREKTGLKRQMVSFGGRGSKEGELRLIADECLIKLGQGEEHLSVKAWAQKKVKELSC